MFNASQMVQSLGLLTCATTAALASTLFSSIGVSAQEVSPNASPNSDPISEQCLSGYPDGTYRGDRAVTRYEFAAGLNTCLNGVNQQLSVDRENLATRADFQLLIERQRELNQQLRDLSNRVDTLSGPQETTRPKPAEEL